MANRNPLLFSKSNYAIMLAGIAVILAGFVVMTLETAPYGFGTLGLTAGPAMVMSGFLIEIYAILHKEKKAAGGEKENS